MVPAKVSGGLPECFSQGLTNALSQTGHVSLQRCNKIQKRQTDNATKMPQRCNGSRKGPRRVPGSFSQEALRQRWSLLERKTCDKDDLCLNKQNQLCEKEGFCTSKHPCDKEGVCSSKRLETKRAFARTRKNELCDIEVVCSSNEPCDNESCCSN